jgi:FkbM family methyltransferase
MKLKIMYLVLVLSISGSLYGGKYYSEAAIGQDKYVNENFFKDKKTGFFVDIGAHAGIANSNTYYFEQLGWEGVCFEPDPRTYKKLEKNRSCNLYNCAVGGHEGMEKFIQHPISWVSGLDSTYHDAHRKQWNVLKEESEKYLIDVKVVTLNKILEDLGVDTIDFLSIDTEGAEKDILMSIDFDAYHFNIIVIENLYEGISIESFLKEKGFKLVKRLHKDEVYVNTEIR